MQYCTFYTFLTQAREMMRFQRSAIFKPVDQMRRNKRQWEAYKKSILTKQSKEESKEN